jgi:hypothetical protein
VSRSAVALTAAALGAALLAPASAQAGLGWHDAEAGVPATVTLKDVARDGETVIAVGKDTVSGEAMIYRLTGGAWQRDPLLEGPLQTPVAGELSKVAAAAGEAWAVGTDGAGKPLLVHLAAPATPPAATPPEWQRIDAPVENTATNTPAMAKPLSAALAGTTFYAGDDAGHVWTLGTTVSLAFNLSRTAPSPPPAPVNGLAFFGDGRGVAVSDPSTTDAGFFGLTPGTGTQLAPPAPAIADAQSPALIGVALRGSDELNADTLAIDAGGYWQLGADHTWRRNANPGLGADAFELTGLALGNRIQALSGKVGTDGYVWHRQTSSDAWKRDKVAAAVINGVAPKGFEDIWAVGDQGTVMHFNFVADPPPKPCNCDPTPNPDPNPNPNPDPTPNSDPNSTPRSNPTTTTVPPADPGDPTIYVVEPDRPATRRPGNRRRPQRRLLDRVAVTREARRLVVSFRLTAPARVAISATRGRATVARAIARAMRAGRRRVALPFTGAPPTELRIVVRPLPAKRAGRARGGNAGA